MQKDAYCVEQLRNWNRRILPAIPVLLACCLAASGATPTQVTFSVIYNASFTYGSPTWITQFSSGVFLWNTHDFILSLSTRAGAVTQLAAVPSGCSTCALGVPVPAANLRIYALLEGDANNPTHPFSFDLEPNRTLSYPPQTYTDDVLLNLPDGQLLGIGGNGTGGYYLVVSDLEGNTIPVNHQFAMREYSGAGPIFGSDGNYYGISVLYSQAGYLYRLTPSGSFTNIVTLPLNCGLPASLIQATDGNFYGLTACGGANRYGAFFQVTMAGQFTLLYSFTNKNPGPGNLLQPATAISTASPTLTPLWPLAARSFSSPNPASIRRSIRSMGRTDRVGLPS